MTTVAEAPTNPRNLEMGKKFDLDWSKGNLRKAAQQVHDEVTRLVESSANWYLNGQTRSRWRAKTIRISAIVLVPVAGIVPTVSEMMGNESGEPRFPAAYSTIILAFVGMLLVIDRFFGYSSSWMRYASTGLQLRQSLQDFRVEWQSIQARWIAEEPTHQQVLEAIHSCKEFLARANNLVAEETKVWLQEFQQSLKQIDDSAKTVQTTSSTGALNLKITNGASCKDGWILKLDGAEPMMGMGTMASRRNLLPVIHTLFLEGRNHEDKLIRAERSFQVEPGKIVELEVTLEVATA